MRRIIAALALLSTPAVLSKPAVAQIASAPPNLTGITFPASSLGGYDRLSVHFDAFFLGFVTYTGARNNRQPAEIDDGAGSMIPNPVRQEDFRVFNHANVSSTVEYEMPNDLRLGFFSRFRPFPEYTQAGRPFAESYVYAENDYGRLELGRAWNIARKMNVWLPDVSPLNTLGNAYHYLPTTLPDDFTMINSTQQRTDRDAPRVTAITAPYGGFQVAGSYIAGIRNLYELSVRDGVGFERGYTGAVAWTSPGNFFKITSGFSRYDNMSFYDRPTVGARARDEKSGGARFYYRGWELAGTARKITDYGFGEMGGNMKAKRDAYAYGYGLAYEIGPLQMSLTDFNSNSENEMSILDPANYMRDDLLRMSLFSLRYTLTRGVDVFGTGGRLAYSTASGEFREVGGTISSGMLVYF